MAIKDLQARQGKVELVAEVVEKGEVREFQKFGKAGRVCSAKIKDDTGETTLTLWNDDIEKVKVGDTIKIQNGYVGEWQGEKQLSTGRFGTLEILESKEKDMTEDEATEEEALNEEKTDEGEHILTEDEKTEEEVLDKELGEDEDAETEDEKEEITEIEVEDVEEKEK